MHCFSFIVNSFQKMYLGACIYRLKKNWFIFKKFQIPRGHNKYTNFLRRKIIHCFSFMYMKSLSSKEDLLLIWCQLFIFVKRKWQTGSNTLFSRANTRKRSLSMFNTLLLSIKRLYASILCAECH